MMLLKCQTDRSGQTEQSQIKLKEQSDQCLRWAIHKKRFAISLPTHLQPHCQKHGTSPK